MNYKNIYLHFDRAIKTYNIHMIMKNRNNIFIYKINKFGKKTQHKIEHILHKILTNNKYM